jgi:hypothetical protein
MSDKIRRILEMLKEGKISSEDAEKLIKAVERKDSKDTKGKKFIVSEVLDEIPGIIENAIGGKNSKSKELTASKNDIKKIIIKALNGNMDIYRSEDDKISLKAKGMLTGIQRGDEFIVKSFNADHINIKTPSDVDIYTTLVSGDITFSDLKNKIFIKSVSGNIDGENITGDLTLKAVSGDTSLNRFNGDLQIDSISGDVDLMIVDGNNINIIGVSSDITVKIPKGIGILIEAKSKNGEVDSEIELESMEINEDNYIKGIRGDKHLNLKIEVKSGDIEILEY